MTGSRPASGNVGARHAPVRQSHTNGRGHGFGEHRSMQAPCIALLDEPLTHLDPAHQARLLTWARGEADLGRAVALTLHDPNWAAYHCDRLLFLFGDGRWQTGLPETLLTPASLEALYGPGTAALWGRASPV